MLANMTDYVNKTNTFIEHLYRSREMNTYRNGKTFVVYVIKEDGQVIMDAATNISVAILRLTYKLDGGKHNFKKDD